MRGTGKWVAVWGAMLVMGVLGGGGAEAQELDFPDLPESHPVGEGLTQPCVIEGGDVLCGRFRVYEDRDLRSGRTLDIAFVVVKALEDSGRTDAVTQFNGGPGAPATQLGVFLAQGAAPFLRQHQDVLLIDHRGTGHSGALWCNVPYPRGVASRFETVFPLDQVDACREMLEKRADLSQYTTARAMDDLAELALWLGYDQLNLSGGSYGTREAQVFTRRHPEMVRTVVMNGVGPVHEAIYVHHARYLQDALDTLFDECEAQAACRTAFPDLREVADRVLETAKHSPAQVQAEGETVTFGIGALSYALRGLLYGQAGTVPARFYEADSGNWQKLADYYLGRQDWVGGTGTPAGYHYSVLCAEDIDPLSWDDIREATEGTFMGDHLIGGYKRACDRWPSAELPDEHFEPISSDVPVLILSGGRDPVTPVSGGEIMADLWTNSVHVVVPNGGHGVGGPCVNQMQALLLRTGSLTGLDTSCIREVPPTQFEIPIG